MLLSGLKSFRSGRVRAALLVLGAAAVLAACKHHMTTADTKGLWIANGNNVVEFVPSQLSGGVRHHGQATSNCSRAHRSRRAWSVSVGSVDSH